MLKTQFRPHWRNTHEIWHKWLQFPTKLYHCRSYKAQNKMQQWWWWFMSRNGFGALWHNRRHLHEKQKTTRVYPKVSGLAAWSENCKWYKLSATRCSFIAILWVSLFSFAAITLRVASQRVFHLVVYFVIDSVRKLLDAPSYTSKNSPAEVTLAAREDQVVYLYRCLI
jgi:hypothetical protein